MGTGSRKNRNTYFRKIPSRGSLIWNSISLSLKEKEIPEGLKNVCQWLLQVSQEGRVGILTEPEGRGGFLDTVEKVTPARCNFRGHPPFPPRATEEHPGDSTFCTMALGADFDGIMAGRLRMLLPEKGGKGS